MNNRRSPLHNVCKDAKIFMFFMCLDKEAFMHIAN